MIDETYYNIAKKYFNDEEISDIYNVVSEIILHDEYQKRKKYLHHEDSVFEHSIHVCVRSIYIAQRLPFEFNYKSIAIGSLLHDFYYKPWQEEKIKNKFFEQHGYVHPKEAHDNANEYFNHLLDDISKEIIIKHMWPLTLRKIPRCKEAWVVNFSDKIEAIKVFKNLRKLPYYVGIK